MAKHYLILASGSYEDYSVSFLELVAAWSLSEREILTLLNTYPTNLYEIVGHIHGELETSLPLLDLRQEVEYRLNGLFACYKESPVRSVLDRLYSRDECLAIALANDADTAFWQRVIAARYADYSTAYPLYRKLLASQESAT